MPPRPSIPKTSERTARRRGIGAVWVGMFGVVIGSSGAAVRPSIARASDRTLVVSRQTPIELSTPHGRAGLRRLAFAIAGVPVRGAFETVRVAPDGTQTVTAAQRPSVAPQFGPEDRRISADALPRIVADHLARERDAIFESPAALVYLLVRGEPVLAWEVQLPLRMHPEPSRPTIWVSAMTGRVLEEQEQVQASRARVFALNPSVSPTPIEVELGGLDVTDAGHPLVGDRVVSFNCVTDEPDEVAPYRDEGECYPAHRVFSDDAGDFFVPLPEVIEVSDNLQPQDRYAELSMYYHAERFLERMRQLGVPAFKCETATMLANFRTLESSGTLPYTPLDNAFYTNQCNPEKGPTMLFGQGTAVDFGYDGDVVYHELGHGMVALLAPDGLAGAKERPEASSPDAGAINEAVADYFAYLMTGDPNLAEYVGRFWSGSGSGQIRTGENQKRCPEDTVGQVHNDGEPFAGALWSSRARVGEVFDEVVLEALTRLPKAASLEDGAAAVEAVAEEFADRGELDAADLDVVRRSFAARGLFDCPRIIEDPERVQAGRTMVLRKKSPSVQPFWPGPMQLHHVVPQGQTRAEVTFSLRARGAGELSARVLVKRGETPITYEYALVAVDDVSDATSIASQVREVTLVRGDWDFEIEPEPLGDGAFRAELTSLYTGESLYVTVVTTSTAEVTASGVAVRTPGYVPPAEEGETDADPEGTGSSDGTEIVRAEGAVAGGCGCWTGQPAPGRAWWAWPWMLIAIRRRR